MKNFYLSFVILLFCFHAMAQETVVKYDKTLAESLGADDRGMKMYFMVILKTGSVKVNDKALRDSLFRGHMANINKLASEGKLLVAGPFENNDKSYRGIFILNAKTVEEVNSMIGADPTIKEGIFTPDIIKWYGSAAISAIPGIHEKIEKK